MASREVVSEQRKVQLIRVETDSVTVVARDFFSDSGEIKEEVLSMRFPMCVLEKRFIFRQLNDMHENILLILIICMII